MESAPSKYLGENRQTKMNIPPRITFLMAAIPLALDASFFEVDKLFNEKYRT